jgi:hypothetical protein
MIAEIWRDKDEIGKIYADASGPALDSAFDFPTRYGLVQALAVEESGARAGASVINAGWAMGAHQGYPANAMPVMMLGNHDLVRFGDLVSSAVALVARTLINTGAGMSWQRHSRRHGAGLLPSIMARKSARNWRALLHAKQLAAPHATAAMTMSGVKRPEFPA